MNSYLSVYLSVLQKYAVFRGRASRREFWIFIFWHVVIMFILATIEGALGVTVVDESLAIVTGIYFIATFIPYVAVLIRRLHDTNHSGWWILINIIPFIGGIVLFVFLLQNSFPGENKYGPSPKTVTV